MKLNSIACILALSLGLGQGKVTSSQAILDSLDLVSSGLNQPVISLKKSDLDVQAPSSVEQKAIVITGSSKETPRVESVSEPRFTTPTIPFVAQDDDDEL